MKIIKECSYCKNDMKYGKDFQAIFLVISFTFDSTHPLQDKKLDRLVCYPCYVRILDWAAMQSGCVKKEVESGE